MGRFSTCKRGPGLRHWRYVYFCRAKGRKIPRTASAILKSRCFGCHNSKTAQSKLDLTSRESALRGASAVPPLSPVMPATASSINLPANRSGLSCRPRENGFRPKS